MTLSLEQVRATRFHLARRNGYEPVDVDSFVDKVELTLAQLIEENDALRSQLEQLSQAHGTLADGLEARAADDSHRDARTLAALVNYLNNGADEERPRRAADPVAGTVLWGHQALKLFGDALTSPLEATVFFAGDDARTTGERVIAAVSELAFHHGLSTEVISTEDGSFWARLRLAWNQLFGRADLATLKRAGELAVHDKNDAAAAESYARAIASLGEAAGTGQAVLHAKNVVFVQVPTGPEGHLVRAARVLTPAEVLEYEALGPDARAPEAVLEFVCGTRQAQLTDKESIETPRPEVQ